MSIVRLNEAALAAMGFDRSMIDALRHVVKQIGQETGGITLPELAEQTDDLKPIVENLVILVAAARIMLATLEAEQTNLPVSGNELARRLDDMLAIAEQACVDRAALARAISDIRDELDAGYPPPTGINTGDQTLTSLGAASYKEGSWTAAIATSGTQPAAPVTNVCLYTKVGRLVTVHLILAAFNISGASGTVSISGLPFQCAAAPAIAACWSWNMGATPIVGRIDVGTSAITLRAATDNTGIPVTNGGGQYLYATVSYLT